MIIHYDKTITTTISSHHIITYSIFQIFIFYFLLFALFF